MPFDCKCNGGCTARRPVLTDHSNFRVIRQEIQQISESESPDASLLLDKQAALKDLEKELEKVQGDSPLVQLAVESDIISEVISGWTGIPTGRMLTDEIATVLKMETLLGERIIGQDHALAAVGQMIQTAHAGIEDPSGPLPPGHDPGR